MSAAQQTGQWLRDKRQSLKIPLRKMAGLLGISPAYLTDIEKDRRTPSSDVLVRIAKSYGIDEDDLRSRWQKPASDVVELASASGVNIRKVPEFLRTAQNLTPEQWDKLIRQAKKMQEGE